MQEASTPSIHLPCAPAQRDSIAQWPESASPPPPREIHPEIKTHGRGQLDPPTRGDQHAKAEVRKGWPNSQDPAPWQSDQHPQAISV